MYIQRLHSIKNFRAFKDWSDEEKKRPHLFGKQTVIFGPNGSGKTTLTEIAYRIQNAQGGETPDACLSGISFDLSDEKTTERYKADSPKIPKLHVFGKRYVEENLQKAFDSGEKGTPLYVLGKKNVALEKQIQSGEEAVDSLVEKNKEEDGDKKKAKKSLDGVIDDIKTDVSDELGSYDSKRFNPNTFNKKKVERLLEEKSALLSADELAKAREDLRVTPESIPKALSFTAPTFSPTLPTQAEELATHNVTARALEALATNPQKANWVDLGLPLHESGDVCAFCLNPIAPQRLKDLEAHFDESHRALKTKAKGLEAVLESLRKQREERQLSYGILCKGNGQVKTCFEKQKVAIDEYWYAAQSWDDACSTMLNHRNDYPHQKPNWKAPPIPDAAVWDAICEEVVAINIIYDERRSSIDTIRRNAENQLRAHVAAKHSSKYAAATKAFSAAESHLKATVEQLTMAKEALEALKGQRSNSNDGDELALALTRDLVAYLGHPDLTVNFVRQGSAAGFSFLRGGESARNLSEGERTAIALLHFLNGINSLGIKEHFSDACVIIDDPVSSLDHDAILAAHSFLLTRLRTPDGALKCRQLMVFTHNFEFFRRWRDTLSKSLAKKADPTSPNSPIPRATLLELLMKSHFQDGKCVRSPSLRSFGPGMHALTSEYYYLFARACESTHPEAEELLPLTGNSTRRLLESFLKFKSPHQTQFTQAAELLGRSCQIPTEIVTIVTKSLHESSHRTEIDIHSPTFRNGIVRVISATLSFMEKADGPHFEGMCKATTFRPYQERSA